jgi:hypothetical protein
MKPGILDTTALIIALCLAAPAQAKTPKQVGQLPAVNSQNTVVNTGRQSHTSVIRTNLPSRPVQDTQHGVIEGSLGYPSESIPPLKICAENLVTQIQHCTEAHIKGVKYRHGVGYWIEVPPGTYHVFASDTEKDAYFSSAVQCGLKLGCNNHEPIAVTVSPGQTITSIDPTDWYNPSTYGLPRDYWTKF